MRKKSFISNLKQIKILLDMHSDVQQQDEDVAINTLSSLDSAIHGSLTFCCARGKSKLQHCQASAVITTADLADDYRGTAKLIVHDNPTLAFVSIIEALSIQTQHSPSIHSSAVCHQEAIISPQASIGPNAVIDRGAIIEDSVSIGPGVYIGENAHIQQASILHANVSVYHDCIIGKNCIIHSGTCVGVDGFGYVETFPGWKKIPHIGRVVIGNNVEIGANTCIDRGMLDDTEIHHGTKIDNLVHIAHNVVIGENGALAGKSGIAGSTTVGKNFRMGGSSGLNGQITVTDNVVVGGGTNIMSSIKQPGFYIGVMPAQTQKDWARSAIAIRKAGQKAKSL